MKKQNDGLPKPDRKTVERDRRLHMKVLCSKLASLIPHRQFKTSKEMLSQLDELQLAASYITQLRERIEGLKRMKEQAAGSPTGTNNISPMDHSSTPAWRLPILEIKEVGSSIEVLLITGLNRNFGWWEAISIIGEEGAEVVSASSSTLGDKIFHVIHAQVRIPRVGVETTKLFQRLQDLVC